MIGKATGVFENRGIDRHFNGSGWRENDPWVEGLP